MIEQTQLDRYVEDGTSLDRAIRWINRTVIAIAIVIFWIGMGNLAVAAVQPGGASQFVRQLGDQAIAALRAPGTGREAREVRLRSLLSERFDLPFIGRVVLGRYWKRATPE
jgi:phospholipid transport system substrate-binding protein